MEQAAKKLNTYDDIEWQKLYTERKLKTLRVNELDLFIEKHKCNIDKSIKKNDKIHVIEAELAKQMAATYMQQKTKKHSKVNESSDESASSDDSETEIVDLDDARSTDESDDETKDESDDETKDEDKEPTVSRFGRRQGNWRTRQFMNI